MDACIPSTGLKQVLLFFVYKDKDFIAKKLQPPNYVNDCIYCSMSYMLVLKYYVSS